MKTMTRLTTLLVLLATASCTHKELCYDHSHALEVDVVFDWCNAPDANPKSMSLYLFPEGQSNALRYEFVNCNGGKIRVVPDTYHAICVNSDTETILHKFTDTHSSYTLTTKETTLLSGLSVFSLVSKGAPMAKGTEDEVIRCQSEKLWVHQLPGIELNERNRNLTLSPETAYVHITVEILNVENLSHVTDICGTISGLADGYLAGEGSVTDDLATIPFGLSSAGKVDELRGEVYTFGHCPKGQNGHFLTIYAIMQDGTKWYHSFDISDQMHEQDGHTIHIVLDHLPVPEAGPGAENGGGGFIPTIDDWNTIRFDINM